MKSWITARYRKENGKIECTLCGAGPHVMERSTYKDSGDPLASAFHCLFWQSSNFLQACAFNYVSNILTNHRWEWKLVWLEPFVFDFCLLFLFALSFCF